MSTNRTCSPSSVTTSRARVTCTPGMALCTHCAHCSLARLHLVLHSHDRQRSPFMLHVRARIPNGGHQAAGITLTAYLWARVSQFAARVSEPLCFVGAGITPIWAYKTIPAGTYGGTKTTANNKRVYLRVSRLLGIIVRGYRNHHVLWARVSHPVWGYKNIKKGWCWGGRVAWAPCGSDSLEKNF